MKTSFQAQIDELAAAYKKASKVELANDVEKKCEGDMKTLILGKLGRGLFTVCQALCLFGY